ncbi:MAG TPA: DUF4340 domain-containing protein [Bryobacteraceae bacterium]|jgi:hypothetical protein|nr:DUF4340 domain-containing protein [Bryobacteraceae bacterium]
MKFARLLIAAAVLAGLGGLVYWSNRSEEAKAGKPDPKAAPKILELKEADIKQIEIRHREGETTVVKKDDSGKWSITAPQPLAADQTAVGAITSAVTNLSSDRLVDENASNLPSYGLDPPRIGVTFTMADGKTHVLRIGEDTPVEGNTYAMLDGDKRLFTIASFGKSALDKQSKDLREKHLLVFDQDKLSRVELDTGKTSLEFGRAGSDWQILKPKPMRADGFKVDELIRKLKDASMDTETDPKAAASAFASGQKIATAKVTGAQGTLTLEVHKAKDDYYAKSSTLAGAYKVTKEIGDGLNKSLEDFRNKKVFDFGFSDPTRIEIKDGGQSKVIEKSGENWTSGGKTMDSISVQNLIDKLRDLAAAKFVDSGFTTSSLEITVVSNDGKRTEKVQIAAAGSNFLARRDNDSSLYQLDTKAVEDLREAAAGVKEPPPPETKDGKKK